MECYICDSQDFVDIHHLDGAGGSISRETLPLCRRCHRTLHDFGIGSFSPDTLDKALEVENKRREILGLPMLTRGDIKHSRYWYKKHGLPTKIRQGKYQLRLL